MKLPSLQILFLSFEHTAKRFPLVILAAFISTVCAILVNDSGFSLRNNEVCSKILMTSSLGLPLFFALHIFCERFRPLPMYRLMIFTTGLVILVQFYFSLQLFWDHSDALALHFIMWSAGLHLIASFSAFFIEEEVNGFWQFNKVLFLRFLTSALYSGVLYLGIAGAILAVQELFGVHIRGSLYFDLWAIIAGLFNTVFFLGGITDPVEAFNTENDYPKGLKIFTQYVLIPLVTIYLFILYAYLVKIVVQMSLPKGWVDNLILAFSVVGILALLLVYPVRNKEENKWIRSFSHFFYFSLVPLLVLLFVAIIKRISAYGVTVDRYVVVLLGVWLSFITLYFIFSKQKNIILIPLTLALFLFGSSFGPWGVFKVSERSQLGQLHMLLQNNGLLVNGKIVKVDDDGKIKYGDGQKMGSIIEYLSNTHGLSGVESWLDAESKKIVFENVSNKYERNYKQELALKQCIGLSSNYQSFAEAPMVYYISCKRDKQEVLNIGGYDRMIDLNVYDKENGDKKNLKGTSLNKNELEFYLNGTKQFGVRIDSIVSGLSDLNKNDWDYIKLTPEQMTVETRTTTGEEVKIKFKDVSYQMIDSVIQIDNVACLLFFKNK